MNRCLLLIFLASTLSGFVSCKQQVKDRSNVFQEIFLDDTTTFRGTQMGEKMDQVLLHEQKQKPVRQDRIGLSYACSLPQNYTMLLDYYSDYLRVEQSEDKLASVVANILMNDEVETAKLYGEIQAYFNQKYGISSGQYGNYSWQGSTRLTPSMEIILKLDNNKKGITLNFVDTFHGNLPPTGDPS